MYAYSSFAVPGWGTFGNSQPGVLRGPKEVAFAAAVQNFPITERVGFQMRAEAFNLFNHPNINSINTSFNFTPSTKPHPSVTQLPRATCAKWSFPAASPSNLGPQSQCQRHDSRHSRTKVLNLGIPRIPGVKFASSQRMPHDHAQDKHSATPPNPSPQNLTKFTIQKQVHKSPTIPIPQRPSSRTEVRTYLFCFEEFAQNTPGRGYPASPRKPTQPNSHRTVRKLRYTLENKVAAEKCPQNQADELPIRHRNPGAIPLLCPATPPNPAPRRRPHRSLRQRRRLPPPRPHRPRRSLTPNSEAPETVWVRHTASRDLSPTAAARAVTQAAHTLPTTPLIFKKVDSAGRGNIAAELLAARESIRPPTSSCSPHHSQPQAASSIAASSRSPTSPARTPTSASPLSSPSSIITASAKPPHQLELATLIAAGKDILLCDAATDADLQAIAERRRQTPSPHPLGRLRRTSQRPRSTDTQPIRRNQQPRALTNRQRAW